MKMVAFWRERTTHERVAICAVVMGLLLLVGQHAGMMLSNSDDPWIVRSSWAMRLQTASEQGRFWLIPINTLAALPYQLGGWGMANAIKMFVNGMAFASFVYFCMLLTNARTGVLMGLVWLALIDVSPGYYSSFHGYLMMFNLQFAVLFISFICYLRVLDGSTPRQTVVLPYVLYAFALLAYEPMLFYAGVYPALYLYRYFSVPREQPTLKGWLALFWDFMRSNGCLAFVVLAYIVTYFSYRHFQPTAGRGVDGEGNLLDIVVTVYKFSIHGLHVQVKALTNYISGDSAPHTLLLALGYAGLVALGCFALIPTIRDAQEPELMFRKWSLAVLGFYVFCPNMLHGLVQAYRQWAAEDPHYVGNYFSSFPLAMAVTLGLLALVGGAKARQEKVLFGMVLAVLATSACDNYMRWGNLAQRNREDSHLWLQAIDDLHARTLGSVPTVLCGLHAPEKVSGDERYWSDYLTEALQRPITYHYKNLSTVACDIELDFNQYRFTSASR